MILAPGTITIDGIKISHNLGVELVRENPPTPPFTLPTSYVPNRYIAYYIEYSSFKYEFIRGERIYNGIILSKDGKETIEFNVLTGEGERTVIL
jgi:hypothetical protein